MRLVIADPALIDNSGHYLNYALSLNDELRRRGHGVRLFGHRGVSAAVRRDFGVEPAFSIGFFESDLAGAKSIYPDGPPSWFGAACAAINVCTPRRRWRRRLRSALTGKILLRRTLDDFRSLHAKMQFTQQDVMLLNSANAIGARGLVHWLQEMPDERRPVVILVLHYAAQREAYNHSSAIERWRSFFAETRTARLESKTLLAADTAELADEFAAIGGRPVAVVPIPHAGIGGRPSGKSAGRPLAVVYAGVGTATKGFHLLPEIIAGVADLVACGKIAFRIQANILDATADMRRAIARLKELNVELIDGSLASVAYYGLLADADILLQPHDPAYYRMQSSGVFAEGRGAGLVAVVPARTTMAEEIARTGGGVAVDDWTAAAYADAVRYCVANFDRLAAQARAAAPAWKKFHSAEGLRRVLNSILPPTHQL